MYVRGGAFIFRQPIVQNTGEMPGNALQLLIAPAADSQSSLYEDDGRSLKYQKGDFMKRQFRQVRNAGSIIVEISAPEGSYRPAKRSLILQLWMEHEPASVTEQLGRAGESSLSRLAPDQLSAAPAGWSYADGLLTIKDNDHFEAVRFKADVNQ